MLACAAAPAAAQAAAPIMPLSEVRSGMRCTGPVGRPGHRDLELRRRGDRRDRRRPCGRRPPHPDPRVRSRRGRDGGRPRLLRLARSSAAVATRARSRRGSAPTATTSCSPRRSRRSSRHGPAPAPASARRAPRLARAARPLLGPLTVGGLSGRTAGWWRAPPAAPAGSCSPRRPGLSAASRGGDAARRRGVRGDLDRRRLDRRGRHRGLPRRRPDLRVWPCPRRDRPAGAVPAGLLRVRRDRQPDRHPRARRHHLQADLVRRPSRSARSPTTRSRAWAAGCGRRAAVHPAAAWPPASAAATA